MTARCVVILPGGAAWGRPAGHRRGRRRRVTAPLDGRNIAGLLHQAGREAIRGRWAAGAERAARRPCAAGPGARGRRPVPGRAVRPAVAARQVYRHGHRGSAAWRPMPPRRGRWMDHGEGKTGAERHQAEERPATRTWRRQDGQTREGGGVQLVMLAAGKGTRFDGWRTFAPVGTSRDRSSPGRPLVQVAPPCQQRSRPGTCGGRRPCSGAWSSRRTPPATAPCAEPSKRTPQPARRRGCPGGATPAETATRPMAFQSRPERST